MIFQDIYTRLRYKIEHWQSPKRTFPRSETKVTELWGNGDQQLACGNHDVLPTFGAAAAKETRQTSGTSTTTTGTLLLLTAM